MEFPEVFLSPLGLESIKEISSYFPAYSEPEKMVFHNNNLGGVPFGCFSAVLTDYDAAASKTYGMFILLTGQDNFLEDAKKKRNYLACVVQVDRSVSNLILFETVSGSGMAEPKGQFSFEKERPLIFVFLIPRLKDDKNMEIGTVLQRDGDKIRFEYKLDGKIMPKAN